MATNLERLKARFIKQGSAGGAAPAIRRKISLKPEHYDFAKFPEHREYETMLWYYDQNKFEFNVFREHLGVSSAHVQLAGRDMINYSSYNYLDLAGDERAREAAKRAVDDFGVSCGSGRAITGEISLHAEFERELCEMTGCEDAVVSVGGYSMNAFTIAYLCRSQDLIVYDELIHNSALAGCKMSGAKRLVFPHNDYDALDRLLTEHREYYERAIVLVEGVYSMDGDIPDIPRIVEIKNQHKALLMVDEAHSMGVIGPRGLGVLDHFPELEAKDIDILFGSMSKSFATCGGYVAGPTPLVRILKQYAPGVLLYGAAPTPANTAAGLAALRIMRAEPERARNLRANAAYFIEKANAAGLDTGPSKGSAVVPLMTGSSEQSLWLSIKLFEENICVFPMIFPIVPRDQARLRFFINTAHTREDIDYTIKRIVALREKMPADRGLF